MTKTHSPALSRLFRRITTRKVRAYERWTAGHTEVAWFWCATWRELEVNYQTGVQEGMIS